MGFVVAAIVVAVAVYVLVCVATGFGPAGDLAGFEPDNAPLRRSFREPTDQVVAAYRSAVAATPGMQLAGDLPGEMLVDMRPTSRVLGGNFGLAIRLRFRQDDAGTMVDVDSRNKVPFALSNHHAAFTEAERALRTRAKQRAGLDEILEGIG